MGCALARDRDFADVYLAVGLLMYYLHPPGEERVAGVRLLDPRAQAQHARAARS